MTESVAALHVFRNTHFAELLWGYRLKFSILKAGAAYSDLLTRCLGFCVEPLTLQWKETLHL